MTETQVADTLKPKADPKTSVDRVMHPNSLANLRPPWRPGASPNPSGRASDGLSATDAPVRALLRRKLAKRRELHRFVNAWIEAAIKGDSQAREQILKRLDPVLDDPAQGRQILTGLKLELQVGKGPVTTVRGVIGQQELPANDDVGVPGGGGPLRQGVPEDVRDVQITQESQTTRGPEVAADQSSVS